ncbi:MAG: Type-1 restriction enzyme R protein [Syntrophorhabdus sp. PtaU1.Bin153]|nr:MAG: Type-1 restriction enzyme R protein [Syntrophorhabdus sp. PtaU1.Bin153]
MNTVSLPAGCPLGVRASYPPATRIALNFANSSCLWQDSNMRIAFQDVYSRPQQSGVPCVAAGSAASVLEGATREKFLLLSIAIIEAKDNNHAVGAGLRQALNYAEILDIPVAFSSDGDGFVEHDRSGYLPTIERSLSIEGFPGPEEIWAKYKKYKGIESGNAEAIAAHDYYFDGSGRTPRYYQQIAINRAVEAIARGQNRILLVMATGTGKTYAAFQIIYRLWKSGTKKRILFLADRNVLIDQTKRGDFKHFKDRMTVIRKKNIDKAFEIYLALYQGLTNYNEDKDACKEFSPDFCDLIVVDECHRGSAAADSAWREILDYFTRATHIGLTATPKETKDVSNIEYFGEPVYTYSLRQGIEDGFLAPYKVIRVGINVDLEGWRPDSGKQDLDGNLVEDRIYNVKDYDHNLVIDERTKLVARRVSEFLKKTDPFDKTIVFCVDIEHAERMRQALCNENPDEVIKSHKYVMRITGDEEEGKRELDNFINPEETYPVIATTSKLMTTGVDAQTCKLIVLDSNINSMTEFKQIIGRGTREPTKEIWYWEHKLPEGMKAYSKTKPMQKSEFESLKKWWKKRKENEQAWKVAIEAIAGNGYNLDIKNPHVPEFEHQYSSAELLAMLHDSFRKSDALLERLKGELENG